MKNIILNETKALRSVLDDGVIEHEGKVISILVRHFLSVGLSKEEVYDEVNSILLKNKEGYNAADSYDYINDMIDNFIRIGKVGLININRITITDTEWKRLLMIEDNQVFRLAFVLLCYYKVEKIRKPNCNGWIKIDKTTLFEEAKIKVEKNSYLKLHTLYKMKYITTTMPAPGGKNKDSIRILFADDESSIGKTMIDMVHLNDIITYCYEFKDGIKYKSCTKCEKRYKVKKGDYSSKYCATCRKETKNIQNKKYRK